MTSCPVRTAVARRGRQENFLLLLLLTNPDVRTLCLRVPAKKKQSDFTAKGPRLQHFWASAFGSPYLLSR